MYEIAGFASGAVLVARVTGSKKGDDTAGSEGASAELWSLVEQSESRVSDSKHDKAVSCERQLFMPN